MTNPSMVNAIPLLAHQGGWDEILLVAGPIVLIVGLLLFARRRLKHRAPAHDVSP